MTRTKKFLCNSLSAALMQIVLTLAGFIIPQIMLRYYGSEINGLVASIGQFISYFSLVEAGISGAAIYALYKPLADKDFEGINGILAATRIFYMRAGYIFVFLTVGFAFIYSFFIKTSFLTVFEVGVLVLVMGISGALEFFTMAKYRVILTADQKLYVISLSSALSILINLLLVVILAKLEVSILMLKTITLFSVFIRSLVLSFYVGQKYKFINYRAKPENGALDKRGAAFYSQVLWTIQPGIPILLATVFLSLKDVSVYSIYNMILMGINGILGIFTSGLSSSFGDIIARKEISILQKTSKEFEFSYYSLITVAYATTFIMLLPFIVVYTKGIVDANYYLPIVGFLFVLNGLLYNVKTPQGMLIISAGMYKETRVQTTIQALIIIIGGIILTPLFGLVGILMASILSNIYRTIDLIVYVPRYITKLPIRLTALKVFRVFITTAIICCPFLFVEIPAENYATWFAFTGLIVLYATIIVVVSGFIFERDEMKGVLARLKSLHGGLE